MLDHVFTDAIGALREAFEGAFLERQAFEEHFQSDVLLGDLTWETSYGLPGEGSPPRVVAHITLDWPSWSQAMYRRWYLEETLVDLPAIEIEIVFRAQRLSSMPDHAKVLTLAPATSPTIGNAAMERASLATEISHPIDGAGRTEFALEVTYEGLYDLSEETLADGSSNILDDHFGTLGGWIASTLVKLGDLAFSYFPPETPDLQA